MGKQPDIGRHRKAAKLHQATIEGELQRPLPWFASRVRHCGCRLTLY